jgi:hypothetical protein
LRQLRTRSAEIFWAMDRALGGDQPPTSVQRLAARYPLRVGMVGSVFASGAFALPALTSETHLSDLVLVLVGGVLMGAVFGLTARGERARQRRLRRRGVWDG